MNQSLNVAVVTGSHPHEVIPFQNLFETLKHIKPFIQHMEDFVSSPQDIRFFYDAVVFYHFHMATPTGEEPGWCEKNTKSALEELGDTKQGILILHHALLAFPEWDYWTKVTGLSQRKHFGYFPNEKLKVLVSDIDHPITQGMSSWEMIEETYTIDGSPDNNSNVLLRAENPKSMASIGWTRQHAFSRVFCLQLGHDNQAWSHPNFIRVLERGIHWLAGRL